jgi:uncharacterized protein YqiB (DUF1249 family)
MFKIRLFYDGCLLSSFVPAPFLMIRSNDDAIMAHIILCSGQYGRNTKYNMQNAKHKTQDGKDKM